MNQSILTLLAVVVAGAIAIASTPGEFSPWETILGFILLLLLSDIDRTALHIPLQLAFLATAGLCVIITIGYPIQKCPLERWKFLRLIPKKKNQNQKKDICSFL